MLCQWLKDSPRKARPGRSADSVYKLKNIYSYGENKKVRSRAKPESQLSRGLRPRFALFALYVTNDYYKNLFSSMEEKNRYVENIKWLQSIIRSHLNNNTIISSKMEKCIDFKIIKWLDMDLKENTTSRGKKKYIEYVKLNYSSNNVSYEAVFWNYGGFTAMMTCGWSPHHEKKIYELIESTKEGFILCIVVWFIP
jgi:hypothetical protein